MWKTIKEWLFGTSEADKLSAERVKLVNDYIKSKETKPLSFEANPGGCVPPSQRNNPDYWARSLKEDKANIVNGGILTKEKIEKAKVKTKDLSKPVNEVISKKKVTTESLPKRTTYITETVKTDRRYTGDGEDSRIFPQEDPDNLMESVATGIIISEVVEAIQEQSTSESSNPFGGNSDFAGGGSGGSWEDTSSSSSSSDYSSSSSDYSSSDSSSYDSGSSGGSDW